MKCDVSFISFSAFLVPIGFFIGAGFVPCDKAYIGVICMTVAVSFMSLRSSGYAANFQYAARWGYSQGDFISKNNLTFYGGQDQLLTNIFLLSRAIELMGVRSFSLPRSVFVQVFLSFHAQKCINVDRQLLSSQRILDNCSKCMHINVTCIKYI